MQKYTMEIEMLENEYWWGGCVVDGPEMPYSSTSSFSRDLTVNPTVNQASPLLLSNKGRYIWCESGYNFIIDEGIIKIESNKHKPLLTEGLKNLRGAFLDASERYFPSSGKSPGKLFFEKPQYNTWIELMYNQNQNEILNYANQILENNMPTGLMMIDCGWAEYYGKWEFHSGKFPDPKAMIDKLHAMGFTVMLWVCPFVSPDSVEYRYLRDEKLLVYDKNGDPSIKKWWDGFSAVLDFSNPKAVEWFYNQTEYLVKKYNIDGFKFDAGDAYFYSDNDVTHTETDPNGQSELWARFGLRYEYNEYRACFKCGGEALAQRLSDKCHSWGNDGVASLIPSALAQGLLGYAYVCPDMIGGGDYLNFMKNSENLDEELFVRYSQCSSLMPMMQYSAAPWRLLSTKNFEICKKSSLIHLVYSEVILNLVETAKVTGEPIIRCMEYVFPNQGLETVTDQFVLGENVIVAPIIKKGITHRNVILPEGEWNNVKIDDQGNKIINESIKGPITKTYQISLGDILIFEKTI